MIIINYNIISINTYIIIGVATPIFSYLPSEKPCLAKNGKFINKYQPTFQQYQNKLLV